MFNTKHEVIKIQKLAGQIFCEVYDEFLNNHEKQFENAKLKKAWLKWGDKIRDCESNKIEFTILHPDYSYFPWCLICGKKASFLGAHAENGRLIPHWFCTKCNNKNLWNFSHWKPKKLKKRSLGNRLLKGGIE